MIDAYQTKEAIALLERIGLPEWEEGMIRFRFLICDVEFCIEQHIKGKHRSVHVCSDYVALCLIRNRLREWLQSHHVAVVFTHIHDKTYAYIETRGYTDHADYDIALLAGGYEIEKED